MATFDYQNLITISNSQAVENGDDIITSLASPSKFPRYTDTARRVESFAQWIKKQTPKMMADAGFFFENQGDKVKCFHCGIALASWDPQDDPWVEHAFWAPSCEYLIAMKGQELVSFLSSSDDSSCHQHQSENEEPSVSESQNNEPPNENISDVTSTNTASYYPESTLRKHPLLTDAAQSVLEVGYLPRDVKIAVDRVLEKSGWQELTGENILDVLMDMEDSGMIKSNSRHKFDHDTLTRISLDDMSDEQLTEQKRKLQEEIKDNNERLQCKICCESPVSIVFLKCGHLVCCAQCAPAMKRCPVCREKVKATVRINLNKSNAE